MGETKKTSAPTDATSRNLLACSQLCEKYYGLLEARMKRSAAGGSSCRSASNGEASAYQTELQLWQELKSNRTISEPLLLHYLIGFYVRLQQLVLFAVHGGPAAGGDPYFVLTGERRRADPAELGLLYNLHIRLGDLNRYAGDGRLARGHYQKARDLNPHRGQSYNQLALLCSQEPIKTIYFYCRAVLANEEAFDISRNNIKFAVGKFRQSNQLVRLLFTGEQEPAEAARPASARAGETKLRVENWLFVVVIAIYCENMQAIARPLLDELLFVCRYKLRATAGSPLELDLLDQRFALSAFDVLLDYCLNDRLHKVQLQPFESDLRELKAKLDELRNAGLPVPDSQAEPALKHDYLLLGLSSLKGTHAKLVFGEEELLNPTDIQYLINRVASKTDALLQMLAERKSQISRQNKKKRNIALQSILGSRNDG